jgi:Flp pilus assembly protein TadG
MSALIAFARRLRRADEGSTMIEFAMIGPIFFIFIFGIFDLGYAAYNHAILEGAVQSAGRNAGLQSSPTAQAALDATVAARIADVNKVAVLSFDRKNYENFDIVGTPEDFVDANGNAKYDSTECFTDVNGNNKWDADSGATGLGGADDVVVYTVTEKFDSMFPLWSLLNMQNKNNYFQKERQLTATTILRNQPFGSQAARPAKSVCP